MQPSQNVRCGCELLKGSYKRVKPAAKSGEPFNVVHMSSTIAASLTKQLCSDIGSRGRYRKTDLPLPVDEKNGQGSYHRQIQGGKIKALRPPSD